MAEFTIHIEYKIAFPHKEVKLHFPINIHVKVYLYFYTIIFIV